MSKCERCGIEFQAYCAKCRDDISNREKGGGHIPSEKLTILVAYDHETGMYRYGCSVEGCPCNMKNGWCSKSTPHIDRKTIQRMLEMLHEYDGDNAVKQWCG